MKQLLFAILIVLCATTSFAQKPGMERILAAKAAYVTDKIHLNKDQYATFLPLYDSYEREIWSTRKAFKQKYKSGTTDDHGSCMQFVDDNIDFQQQVLDIKKKYKDQFLKLISAQQLADLYVAEREFNQLLLKRMKERHEKHNEGASR